MTSALDEAGSLAIGGVLYATLEPCPHGTSPGCVERIIASGISKVVCASAYPDDAAATLARNQLRSAGIVVEFCELHARQAERLNRSFLKRMRTGLPHVRCKVALSLDGRIALGSGESRWITCPRMRDAVHQLRARTDAVLVGIGTALQDDPGLDARLSGGEPRGEAPPVKVILDTHLRLPHSARLLRSPGETWVMTGKQGHIPGNARVFHVPCAEGGVHMPSVLRALADEGINEVLVEGGRHIFTSAMQSGWADEWILHYGPKILGSGIPPFDIAFPTMADVPSLQVEAVATLGDGFEVTLVRAESRAAAPQNETRVESRGAVSHGWGSGTAAA